jgi:purine-binding chemotaxis protein CheW
MTIHQKISRSASDLMPNGKSARIVLMNRAKKINETVHEKIYADKINYIRFEISNEYYGIPYQYIQKVYDTVILTKVPHADIRIAGITNYQGKLLTVIDLKKFFHLSDITYSENIHMMVCKINDISIGILADEIDGSHDYDKNELLQDSIDRFAIDPTYIMGVHQGKTTILNIEKIFQDMKT